MDTRWASWSSRHGPALPVALFVVAVLLAAVTCASPGADGVSSGGGRHLAAPRAVPPAAAREPVRRVPVRLPRDGRTQPGGSGSSGPSPPGSAVALRQLVVATDPDDLELPAWRSILGRIGTPYDVLFAGSETIDRDRLVRGDGTGRYNAVLLTSGGLLVRTAGGRYASALDEAGWAALWAYERAFGVRQVVLNAGPGAGPEDYCLDLVSEGPTGARSLLLRLTAQGAAVFDYLRPDARLPLADAYVYRTSLAPGCDAEPLLTAGDDVLAVRSTSPDGRQRVALTFTVGAVQPIEELLGFGLLRWATHGVFLGEQRQWLSVDVDDWFNANAHGPAGAPAGRFRMSGSDAEATARGQRELRARYPLAARFALHAAYNGGGIDAAAAPSCGTGTGTGTGTDPLTSSSRCLIDDFRWVNHTLTHPQMNTTSYDDSYREINDNLRVAAELGIPLDADVLKTPEYSGLGVHRPDLTITPGPQPDDAVVDYGLGASNPDLLRAASDLGVRYLHGNMSFDSHRPDCFNCGTRHPLQGDILLVPDWPTSIAWEATTPHEETARFNAGAVAAPDADTATARNLTYEQIIDLDAGQALRHVMRGSAYTHTFHQTNLREYAPGRSLLLDWLDAVLGEYSALYTVPLHSPQWGELARYVEARTRHFDELARNRDAVWDRSTNAVTYTPVGDTPLFVTGLATRPATPAEAAGSESAEAVGSDTVSRLSLAAGVAVMLEASPRP